VERLLVWLRSCAVFQREESQNLVEVIATQVRETIACDDSVFCLTQVQNRDVKCSAAEVVYQQPSHCFYLAHGTVEDRELQCGRRGFVHQSQDFKTRVARGILG